MFYYNIFRQTTCACVDMFYHASLALRSKLLQLLHQSGSQSCKSYPFLPFVWISCASLCIYLMVILTTFFNPFVHKEFIFTKFMKNN